MLKKEFSLIISIILCSAALLSCGIANNTPPNSKDIISPNKSDELQPSDNDEQLKDLVISDIDNIIKLDENDYTGTMIKEITGEAPFGVYLTEEQLKNLINNYSEDSFRLSSFSEEKEIDDNVVLSNFNMLIANNNEYTYGSDLKLDVFIKYTSEKKVIGDYAYQYYVLNMPYYGTVVYYSIFRKTDDEWTFYFDWAYTKSKKNITKDEFLEKQIIFNTMKDDMQYFCIDNSSENFPTSYMYLSNGQTGVINYKSTYIDQYDECYYVCKRIILLKLNLFDILQDGDQPEEVLKNFKG